MYVKENWALFIEGTEIKWTFGDPSIEFQKITMNFLLGLGNFGEELFGEGIASITFDLKRHSGLKASEIFIVSLKDRFFLVVSDPATTLLLITIKGGIPHDIKEIMTAVLVGQASIHFATSITDLNHSGKRLIEKKYHDIILDINEEYLENDLIHTIVGKSGCNFSILSFEECLLLHFHLRKQIEPTDYRESPSWCLISHEGGGDIPFSFNIDNDLVIGGYFAAIIGFIYTLFGSNPKYISFGSTHIRRVRFVYGENYFMAIDTSFMIDLLLKRQFQKRFFGTSYSIIKDMSSGFKELIIEEIIQFNEQKLNELTTEILLDTYIGEGSEEMEFYFGKGIENSELLREERMNQVLRVWGRYLSNL